MLAQNIGAPVNDGVINEYRCLDRNGAIPLSVAVAKRTFIVALHLRNHPMPKRLASSAVRRYQPGRNTIYADLGGGYVRLVSIRRSGVGRRWVGWSFGLAVGQNADGGDANCATCALHGGRSHGHHYPQQLGSYSIAKHQRRRWLRVAVAGRSTMASRKARAAAKYCRCGRSAKLAGDLCSHQQQRDRGTAQPIEQFNSCGGQQPNSD